MKLPSKKLRTLIFLEDRPAAIHEVSAHRDLLCDHLIVVSSSYQARILLRSLDSVDAIVSDVHLENESVFDFLRYVKSKTEYSHIPFVFLCIKPSRFTKSANDSLQIAATALGADCYLLMEEFDITKLQSQLTQCISTGLPAVSSNPAEIQCAPDCSHGSEHGGPDSSTVVQFKKRQG
jgi:response regulator RpfG family c-di-GMP phosphodiesterase